MRLLFVTTSQSAVRKVLSEQEDVDLDIIDCSDCPENDFNEKKQFLLSSIECNLNKYGPPDVLLTYRCPYVIHPHLYEQARLGAFNIHPSLLPKYKGLNPWREIFRNKESQSGVTLHKITNDVDNGIIVSQKSFVIETSDTLESARSKADALAASIANDFISNLKLSVNLFSLPNKFDYLEAINSRENLLFLQRDDSLVYNGVFKEGAFCIVFQTHINGEKYAIRCWKCLNDINKQKLYRRMELVSNWISNIHPRYMYDLYIYENGIATKKGIQPVTVMRWFDDVSLRDFLSLHIQEPYRLRILSDSFVVMVSYFHNLHIAHGDLNMDNIRVSTKGALYVIDYDTFYVPTMKDEKDDEKGKLEYQHHARRSNLYLSEYIDYYSEYVIYLTIRSLAKYPEIWNLFEFTNAGAHILNQEELSNIKGSRIYSFINEKNDKEIISILDLMDNIWHNENQIDTIIPIEKTCLIN